MNLVDLKAALTQRFVDTYSVYANGVPVFYDNQTTAEPPVDQPYTAFGVRLGSSELGDQRTKVQLGRVWLKVRIPAEQGDGQALAICEGFAAAMRNRYIGKAVMFTEELSYQPKLVNGMFEVSISVPFRALLPIQ